MAGDCTPGDAASRKSDRWSLVLYIVGIGGGEHSRLEELLTQEALSHAWRFCCRLSRSREDAEDLLQDSLARALATVEQLQQPEAFSGWLARIIYRRFLDLQRKRRPKEEQVIAVEAESAWQVQADADDPRAASLAQALARLPGDQRALLCRHYLDGAPAEQIAREQGASRGAVEQRLHRARYALKRLIENMRGGDHHEP